MNFKKVFRGYDPKQVDKYIAETAQKEQQLRTAQKERIDELSDENYALRQQIKQYQTDEQAISKSLIASQQLAQELKFDAEKYSELVLSRAKIFYATWRAYAQTLLASLSDEEVRQFNILQKKLENVINAYEGKDVAKETAERELAMTAVQDTAQDVPQEATDADKGATASAEETSSQPADVTTTEQEHAQAQEAVAGTEEQNADPLSTEEEWRHAREVVDVTPSETTMGIYQNPIRKVEEASDQVIDLRELTQTDLSLEELCAELGLIVKKD